MLRLSIIEFVFVLIRLPRYARVVDVLIFVLCLGIDVALAVQVLLRQLLFLANDLNLFHRIFLVPFLGHDIGGYLRQFA